MYKDIEELYRNGYNVYQITIILSSKREYDTLSFYELRDNVSKIAFSISYNDSKIKKAC